MQTGKSKSWEQMLSIGNSVVYNSGKMALISIKGLKSKITLIVGMWIIQLYKMMIIFWEFVKQ